MQQRCKHAFPIIEVLRFPHDPCEMVTRNFEAGGSSIQHIVQSNFETPACQNMSLGAAGDTVEIVGSRRRLRRNGKKGVRRCKEEFMCDLK
jgi:hypothetical protein